MNQPFSSGLGELHRDDMLQAADGARLERRVVGRRPVRRRLGMLLIAAGEMLAGVRISVQAPLPAGHVLKPAAADGCGPQCDC